MKAYICVYRHPIPNIAQFNKAKDAATRDGSLKKYLDQYEQDNCFYDLGDDPAFFAAEEFAGDVRKASWGVCRRNVRNNLNYGDMVIFFCGKANRKKIGFWDYYFIGLGTVRATITDRNQLWQDDQYKIYRQFYNLLVSPDKEGCLVHKEIIQPPHKDWDLRKDAPYILFDPDDELTHFNLINPLHVATYSNDIIPEEWLHSPTGFVEELEYLLFIERGIKRRLRTSITGTQHVHIRLNDEGVKAMRKLSVLRKDLLNLSVRIEGRSI